MSKSIIFVGATLPEASRPALPDLEFAPPARQGDGLRALEAGFERVAIIDADFHGTPTIGHTEILALLARGVVVLGGASFGAIRAMELSSFGMVGVGQVFEGLDGGHIERDEDVVAFDELGADRVHRRVGEALIDIVDFLRTVENAGLLESRMGPELVTRMALEPRPTRTWERLFHEYEAIVGKDRGPLRDVHSSYIRLSERDALLVVEALVGRAESRVPIDPIDVPRTVALDRLYARVRTSRTESTRAGTSESLEDRVLLRYLATRELERLGIELALSAAQTKADEFRRSRNLESPALLGSWLERKGVTLDEWSRAMREGAAISLLRRVYAEDLERDLPIELALDS